MLRGLVERKGFISKQARDTLLRLVVDRFLAFTLAAIGNIAGILRHQVLGLAPLLFSDVNCI